MEITGTIKELLEERRGVSQKGKPYLIQPFVIEHGEQYPSLLVLRLVNDKCDQYAELLEVGKRFRFSFDVESREYNGKYYTDCKVWKIEPAEQQVPEAPMVSEPLAAPAPPQFESSLFANARPQPQGEVDTLPF